MADGLLKSETINRINPRPINPATIKHAIANIARKLPKMSSDSLGGVAAALWFVSGLAGFLAAGIGIFGWKEARKESRAREGQIAALNDSAEKQKGTNLELTTKLEEQRERAAKAEESLQQFKFRMLLPRGITDESVEILKNGAKGAVSVLYLANNQEAYLLSQHVRMAMQDGGWTVSTISPTTVDRAPALGATLEVGVDLYLDEESNAAGGVILREPGKTLLEFMKANIQSAGMVGFQVNRRLRSTALVIVIGPKI